MAYTKDMEDRLKIININLKKKLPRGDSESKYLYVKRLIKTVTDTVGYGIGFQKIWRYHSGINVNDKIKIKGNEILWGIALANLLYEEPNCFSL